MNAVNSLALLAWQNPFSHMGKNFRDGFDGSTTTQLLILVAVLIVIGAVVALLVRHFNYKDGVSYHRPARLFYELCEAHELDRRQQRDLRRLAKKQQIAQPAQLFLYREPFDAAIENSTDDDAEQVKKLRDIILGD